MFLQTLTPSNLQTFKKHNTLKKIFWILALVALAFIGDRIGGLVLKKAADSSKFRYSRLYNGSANAEILLVGNSRGLIFYQPYIEEITGKNTFNTSYNGMPIDLSRVFVDDYLQKYPKVEKMILDITMCDRINDQLIAGFNVYTPYSKRLSKLIEEKQETMYYGAQFSHLFRYNGEIFLRSLKYTIGGDDEDWLTDRVMNDYITQGVVNEEPYSLNYKNRNAKVKAPSLHGFDKLFAKAFNYDDKNDNVATDSLYILDQLALLVDNAKKKGVEVHLVVNPYYPPFAEKIINLDSMKMDVEKLTGLKVKDYSKAITDPKGYSDYQHLNKYGSRLYLDLLKKDGVL